MAEDFITKAMTRERCPICSWPMAESQEGGCVPGDCSYRPDDPIEQQRIRRRRAEIERGATQALHEFATDYRKQEETIAALVKALTDLLDDKATTYAVRVMRARDVLASVGGAVDPR